MIGKHRQTRRRHYGRLSAPPVLDPDCHGAQEASNVRANSSGAPGCACRLLLYAFAVQYTWLGPLRHGVLRDFGIRTIRSNVKTCTSFPNNSTLGSRPVIAQLQYPSAWGRRQPHTRRQVYIKRDLIHHKLRMDAARPHTASYVPLLSSTDSGEVHQRGRRGVPSATTSHPAENGVLDKGI